MGIVIGIDEAGLGPNLGPFVVTATVWEVPGSPQDFDFWSYLGGFVCADVRIADGRVHVCDSKLLFQPHQGLKRLEQSVLVWLAAAGVAPASLRQLRSLLGTSADAWQRVPWLQDYDLPLPHAACAIAVSEQVERLKTCGVNLRQVRCRMLDAADFNAHLERGNKSELVTRCHLELLREVCDEFAEQPVLVQSDKHGGRTYYAGPLSSIWDGAWVETVRESAEQSVYRLNQLEIRFQPKAESLFPVAVASMVCKYMRELEMELFNRFWTTRVPGLAPTQGYPLDARRFFEAIESHWTQMELPVGWIWRSK